MSTKSIERALESTCQIWICPISKKNLKHSIDNKMNVGNGQIAHAWAFNKKFMKKWEKMKEGDICLFGKSEENYTRAAIVIKKIDISQLDHWPYRGEDGKTEWSWGFFLSGPLVINIEYKTLMKNVRQKRFSTQTLLDNNCAKNVKQLIKEYLDDETVRNSK